MNDNHVKPDLREPCSACGRRVLLIVSHLKPVGDLPRLKQQWTERRLCIACSKLYVVRSHDGPTAEVPVVIAVQ